MLPIRDVALPALLVSEELVVLLGDPKLPELALPVLVLPAPPELGLVLPNPELLLFEVGVVSGLLLLSGEDEGELLMPGLLVPLAAVEVDELRPVGVNVSVVELPGEG